MSDAVPAGFASKMVIDGKLVDGRAGTFVNVNPATEGVLGAVADGSVEDMLRAIDAARRAFDDTDWATNTSLRKRCLLQLRQALECERQQLREELIAEAGCPRAITYGPQLDAPLHDGLTYPAKLIDEYPWELSLGDAFISLTAQSTTRVVWREPVGVVGAIVPWNFPFEVILHKLGQALGAGNTVVLKPAPDTPFNATRIGRLIAENIDIPPGVVNVVTASDHLVGEQLTLSPKVDLISFTGSPAVGKRIMEKGAATMKRLFLELGGKSATIVRDDAGLGTACAIGIAPCMHAGQGCVNPTRLLLPRSMYDDGVAMLQAMYESVLPGDPQDPATLCGPVISAKQRERVLGYIRTGVEEGATCLVGGPDAETGFFVRANAFHRRGQCDDHRPGGDLWPGAGRGPLRGRRRRGAHRQRQRLRAGRQRDVGITGTVTGRGQAAAHGVYRTQRHGRIRTPFGGFKASGVGRQNGVAGFDQYTEVKSVAYPAS